MALPGATLLASLVLPLSQESLREASYGYVDEVASLPLPGHGDTLGRWRALAAIAAADVCLAKVLEAHFDAQAIFAELGQTCDLKGQLWAVWAAEPPDAVLRVGMTAVGPSASGKKAWCSGADIVTHALATARSGEDRLLVRLDMAAEGVSTPASAWDAVGMARVVSGELHVEGTPTDIVGRPGEYLSRPGFWHGGAGIAACWFGGAVAIADTLRAHPRVQSDPLAATHLGVIDFNLAAGAALLRETAALIDHAPTMPHVTEVIRVRSFVERLATEIIDRVGRSLGAGPLCQDHAHAQRCADLTTFIRQSHADRDWQGLGKRASERDRAWQL